MISMRREPSELLALGVAYTAFTKAVLAAPPDRDCLNELLQTFERRSAVTHRFLKGCEIAFDGLYELQVTLRSLAGKRLIVAASDLGSLQMSAVALARCGRRIVTPYWGISERFTKVARETHSVLLNLAEHGPARPLARVLTNAQHDGLLPFLLIEAPRAAPLGLDARRCAFLGFSVRCSRFLCWFGARSGSDVLLLWNTIETDGRVTLHHRALGHVALEMTPVLLAAIEAEILLEPAQYAWECAATLFSDPMAARLALAELPRIVDWRERALVSQG